MRPLQASVGARPFRPRPGWTVSQMIALDRGAPCSAPRGVAQRLQHVLALQIGVFRQHFLNAVACSDLAHNHSHRHAHPPDARFSTHHSRVLRDAIQLCHPLLPANRARPRWSLQTVATLDRCQSPACFARSGPALLREQLEILKPRAVLALGSVGATIVTSPGNHGHARLRSTGLQRQPWPCSACSE